MAAVKEAGIPDGALPQIYISGCPSSCGTHQTGVLGFRGGTKTIDGKPLPAYALFVNGSSRQAEEALGREVGVMPEEKVPAFLIALGKTVAASGMDYAAWHHANSGALEELAKDYLF